MDTLNLTKNQKKVLFFWQEICFIVLLVFMLISMLVSSVVNSAFVWDMFNIVFFCLFGLFLFSFVGQFFWKNAGVAFVLSILSVFGSVWMLLAVFSEMAEMHRAAMPIGSMWFGVVLFGGYLIASVSMPVKYLRA